MRALDFCMRICFSKNASLEYIDVGLKGPAFSIALVKR